MFLLFYINHSKICWKFQLNTAGVQFLKLLLVEAECFRTDSAALVGCSYYTERMYTTLDAWLTIFKSNEKNDKELFNQAAALLC